MRLFPGWKRIAGGVASLLVLYLAVAYVALPYLWEGAERGAGGRVDMRTLTPQGIPGDPINIGLVGERDDVLSAFAAARWHPADPVTIRSSLGIGISVLFDRPYADAPVSTLIFDGRRQDLAFERAQGKDADRRHHLRLWQMADKTADGRPLWLGAASFDRGVGLSRDTLQLTHHIAADLDAERDRVIADLEGAGVVLSTEAIAGSGATDDGRNGEGDLYRTDGRAVLAVLASAR